jgi:ankyrin repeat protein
MLLNNILHLKVFTCYIQGGMKTGMKRLNEFLERYNLTDTANMILPGGINALNYACLHGNYPAVEQLISCGAQVNSRCKSDHFCSPLHEAVVGRNVDVVKYLISKGANQVS